MYHTLFLVKGWKLYTYYLILSHRSTRRGNAHTFGNPMVLFWRARKWKKMNTLVHGDTVSVKSRAKPCIFCPPASENTNNSIKDATCQRIWGFRPDAAVNLGITTEHFLNQVHLLSESCKIERKEEALIKLPPVMHQSYFFFPLFVRSPILILNKHDSILYLAQN